MASVRAVAGHAVKWVCCQLGAREHYAIPRSLHRAGALHALVTEMWLPRCHPLGAIQARLRQRFHPELGNACVVSANFTSIVSEFSRKLMTKGGWALVLQRNQWFQSMAVRQLAHLHAPNSKVTLFAYSYAARELLQYARTCGWQTILGQIDPGPAEERIVAALSTRDRLPKEMWEPAPSTYWDNWREECTLADYIVVNSLWSQNALQEEGVPRTKMRLLPLAYEPPVSAAGFTRVYPEKFSAERPLRVLFLGQINLRKGIRPLLEAVEQLSLEPLEFWFVGPIQCDISAYRSRKTITWIGPVARDAVADYYRAADILIFPTFSDGFGLTQLEAQAWKLPVIASPFCGDVIKDGHNGVRLPAVDSDAICTALLRCIALPGWLQHLSKNAAGSDQYSLNQLSRNLLKMAQGGT